MRLDNVPFRLPRGRMNLIVKRPAVAALLWTLGVANAHVAPTT